MRKALPDARIISLDPSAPKQFLSGVKYLVKGSFRDFKKIDWAKMGVDPDETLVFFDDHNSLYRRMFKENNYGFYRFIGEDNYDYLRGDNMSLKWVCGMLIQLFPAVRNITIRVDSKSRQTDFGYCRTTIEEQVERHNTRQLWAN